MNKVPYYTTLAGMNAAAQAIAALKAGNWRFGCRLLVWDRASLLEEF